MRSFNIKLRMEYFLLGLRDSFGIPFKPEEEVNKLNLKEGEMLPTTNMGYTVIKNPLPSAFNRIPEHKETEKQ